MRWALYGYTVPLHANTLNCWTNVPAINILRTLAKPWLNWMEVIMVYLEVRSKSNCSSTSAGFYERKFSSISITKNRAILAFRSTSDSVNPAECLLLARWIMISVAGKPGLRFANQKTLDLHWLHWNIRRFLDNHWRLNFSSTSTEFTETNWSLKISWSWFIHRNQAMSTKNTMCTSPICRYPFQRHKSSNISSNWWDLWNRWAWNWTNMDSTTETPSCCSTILPMHAQLLFMTTPSFTAIESKWRLLTTSQFLQYLTITIRKRLKFQRSHQLRQNRQ